MTWLFPLDFIYSADFGGFVMARRYRRAASAAGSEGHVTNMKYDTGYERTCARFPVV